MEWVAWDGVGAAARGAVPPGRGRRATGAGFRDVAAGTVMLKNQPRRVKTGLPGPCVNSRFVASRTARWRTLIHM